MNSIDRLTKSNYGTWKIQMEAVLVKHNLWEYTNGKLALSQSEAEQAAWMKKDAKARADIVLRGLP